MMKDRFLRWKIDRKKDKKRKHHLKWILVAKEFAANIRRKGNNGKDRRSFEMTRAIIASRPIISTFACFLAVRKQLGKD